MSKDNSEISKKIINFVINREEYPNLSEDQMKVLTENLPKALKNISAESLIKNNRIKGTDNKIYKINYNKLSKWVSFTGSQKRLSKVMIDLDVKQNTGNTAEQNLFKIIEEKGVNAYVEQMLKYMNVDDVWILINKEISYIETISIDDLQFEFEHLTTDILLNRDKKTWYIKWNGDELFQIQSSTSNRPHNSIFRINKNLISEFIKKVKNNTETWGISVEVALCKIYSINIPKEYEGRYNDDLVKEATEMILEYSKNKLKLPVITECLATVVNGSKKSSTDFMAGPLKVSVKSNYNGSSKVCPPEIGQPGLKEGLKHYNRIMSTNFTSEEFLKSNYLEFKRVFQEKISDIMHEQVKMLFSEDFILYLRKTKTNKKEIRFIDTRKANYSFKKSHFTFSRSPENWNESVSIRYKEISVAEMQMHSQRSPFKFRLNLNNLMKILENDQGN